MDYTMRYIFGDTAEKMGVNNPPLAYSPTLGYAIVLRGRRSSTQTPLEKVGLRPPIFPVGFAVGGGRLDPNSR